MTNTQSTKTNTTLFGYMGSDRHNVAMYDLERIMQNHFPLVARSTWTYAIDALNGCEPGPAINLPQAINDAHLCDLDARRPSIEELISLSDIELFVFANYVQRYLEEPEPFPNLEDAIASFSGRDQQALFPLASPEAMPDWGFRVLANYEIDTGQLYEIEVTRPTGIVDDGEITLNAKSEILTISGFAGINTDRGPLSEYEKPELVEDFMSNLRNWFRAWLRDQCVS